MMSDDPTEWKIDRIEPTSENNVVTVHVSRHVPPFNPERCKLMLNPVSLQVIDTGGLAFDEIMRIKAMLTGQVRVALAAGLPREVQAKIMAQEMRKR